MIDLRRLASDCLAAAVAAVDGRRLVADALRAGGVGRESPGRGITLIAVGKAALGMARGALDIVGEKVTGGLVVVPEGTDTGPELLREVGVDVLEAGHPLPTAASVRAAGRIREIARRCSARDEVLVLISGGASALMTLPAADLALTDVQATVDALLRAGAPIGELNTVRKQLDELKGGGLARLLAPARVRGLVISDVVGDRLEIIGSGPLTDDPTTAGDAVRVLRQYGLWADAPDAVRTHLLAQPAANGATPARREPSESLDVRVIGSNGIALAAALAEAGRHGFSGRLLTATLEGEARDVGKELARLARGTHDDASSIERPVCLAAGGETTVAVRGAGLGGRNQEVALSAAIELEGVEGVLLAAMGSDGIDGPTNAAGAWADGATVGRARALGMSASGALAENDSYSFFAALDDLILTGPTGTNVMDLVLVLVA